MTGYEPPEDPSEAPTGLYDYSGQAQGSPKRSTWYRNPIVLLAAGLFVAIPLGLAFYLLADRTRAAAMGAAGRTWAVENWQWQMQAARLARLL